jgi:hypothetical protein
MSRLACLLFVALAVAASGCVTAQATGEPGGPALAPPDPPPHTVIPVTIVEPPPAQPASDLPDAVISPASGVKTPRSGGGSSDKSGAKPPDAVPAQPAAPPAPPLQTTTFVDETEKAIRDRIGQARFKLGQVNQATLDADRRLQFDTAKRFLEQAEDALKVKNLLFAEELTNKAATLAEALAKK